MEPLAVRPLAPPPWAEIEPLIAESAGEGFRFLARLRDEHRSGAVRFDGPGEVLLGVYAGDSLVALGGLTADPYASDGRTGRIRHVYVARAFRRRGAGRLLLDALVAAARGRFAALTLRTDTDAAARFYESLGFEPVDRHGTHSHRLLLPEG
ncbi:MAG TPA: GNAT family N-acetyltransferase [Longimicrobiaceae bacterium]|nr:GNAT family N-acetyltransferase [Longimicrobiaceae bacterium]